MPKRPRSRPVEPTEYEATVAALKHIGAQKLSGKAKSVWEQIDLPAFGDIVSRARKGLFLWEPGEEAELAVEAIYKVVDSIQKGRQPADYPGQIVKALQTTVDRLVIDETKKRKEIAAVEQQVITTSGELLPVDNLEDTSATDEEKQYRPPDFPKNPELQKQTTGFCLICDRPLFKAGRPERGPLYEDGPRRFTQLGKVARGDITLPDREYCRQCQQEISKTPLAWESCQAWMYRKQRRPSWFPERTQTIRARDQRAPKYADLGDQQNSTYRLLDFPGFGHERHGDAEAGERATRSVAGLGEISSSTDAFDLEWLESLIAQSQNPPLVPPAILAWPPDKFREWVLGVNGNGTPPFLPYKRRVWAAIRWEMTPPQPCANPDCGQWVKAVGKELYCSPKCRLRAHRKKVCQRR